jgi:hypothetical protein
VAKIKTIAVCVLVLFTIALGIWMLSKKTPPAADRIAWRCAVQTAGASQTLNGTATVESDGNARVKFDPELPAVPICVATDIDRPANVAIDETVKGLVIRVWEVQK